MSNEQRKITWTREKLKRFKRAYKRFKRAYIENSSTKEIFLFEGDEYFVSYAEYLIEYLDGLFGTGD